MKFILLSFIKFYQLFISPILVQVFGTRCRYSLSCSEYAKQTIAKEGVIKGSVKSIKRLMSCQPYAKIKYEYS